MKLMELGGIKTLNINPFSLLTGRILRCSLGLKEDLTNFLFLPFTKLLSILIYMTYSAWKFLSRAGKFGKNLVKITLVKVQEGLYCEVLCGTLTQL